MFLKQLYTYISHDKVYVVFERLLSLTKGMFYDLKATKAYKVYIVAYKKWVHIVI